MSIALVSVLLLLIVLLDIAGFAYLMAVRGEWF